MIKMMGGTLLQRVRDSLRNPHFEANGAENLHGEDKWLDNDDIRPLRLADRTWNLWTYLTFWFSASMLLRQVFVFIAVY